MSQETPEQKALLDRVDPDRVLNRTLTGFKIGKLLSQGRLDPKSVKAASDSLKLHPLPLPVVTAADADYLAGHLTAEEQPQVDWSFPPSAQQEDPPTPSSPEACEGSEEPH